ncbi:DMT family transporter [Loktanella sp. DJP18]|uniref:DMT family transporter n=1 Tax=Loktanella sp. DJP18 TaxID=3409788 RepID=UPI003BB81124
MKPDRPLAGMGLMLLFCLAAPLGDGMAKLLGGSIGLLVLMLARFATQAILLAPVCVRHGTSLRPPPGTRAWVWLRSLLHVAGMGLMFAALRVLPLADALAIAFVMPFIALLLGWFLLSEAVGAHRIGACAVGFVGTLLVIQPNFSAVGAAALLPLGVAVSFCGFMLVTRHLSGRLGAIRMQAISGWQGSLVVGAALLVWPGPGLTALPVTGSDWTLLAVMAVLGVGAQLAMTASLTLAPAATLAPMQYLEIPFGVAIGWIMFRDLPDGVAQLGIAITVAAGLYVIARERHLSRQPMPPVAGSAAPGLSRPDARQAAPPR